VPRLQRVLPLLQRKLLTEGIELNSVGGEVPVVEVGIPGEDRDAIYVTDAGSQLLCIVYLWKTEAVRSERRAELMATMLALNPSVPLSSFGIVGGHYVLFGALSPDSSDDDLALELATLSDNGVDAGLTFAEFLE
ncbi:MAG: DUF2170 family protein, partial [Xanthomonadales bacterium]|nr:DUF2170 family protein [Xanthomonadales bacterium]